MRKSEAIHDFDGTVFPVLGESRGDVMLMFCHPAATRMRTAVNEYQAAFLREDGPGPF